MARVTQGSIVRAVVNDPQGGNPKPRPLVVISTNSEMDREGVFFGVAITGEFADPMSPDEVLMRFSKSGRCATGLKKKCVAKCGWRREVPLAAVLEIKGHASTAELEQILARVNAVNEPKDTGGVS